MNTCLNQIRNNKIVLRVILASRIYIILSLAWFKRAIVFDILKCSKNTVLFEIIKNFLSNTLERLFYKKTRKSL